MANEKWNKERIVLELDKIYKERPQEFNSNFLRKNHNKLMNAVYRKFGNFQKAVDHAGIEFNVLEQQTLNYENVKYFIETKSNSGCLLKSRSYENSKTELEIVCKCGNAFFTSIAYFKSNNKRQCDECGLLKKTDDEFKKEIKEKFGDAITVLEKYRGGKTPLRFNCFIHGGFEAPPVRILDNALGCAKCGFNLLSQSLLKGYRQCSICKSDNLVREFNGTGLNYCDRHYTQMRKYGHIKTKLITDKNEIIEYADYAEVILVDRYVEETGRALVSLNQIDKISKYKWYLMNNGYVSTKSQGNPMLLHRFITNVSEEYLVDHINRIRTDCRDENLRKSTYSQNAMNSSLSKRNTSGTTGVWYSHKDNKWVAEIFAKGKKYFLGRYNNIEEAIKIRQKAELKYFKEFAPKRSDQNG